MRNILGNGLALFLLAGVPVALAQTSPKTSVQPNDLPNWRAPPRYSTLSLRAGFEPDPREVPVEAGGTREALAIRPDCAGWIDFSQPDVDLNYEAGQFPLVISAISNVDTTIVINDPAGNWHCNDDLIGLDPGVVFTQPLRGNYNIWVGTLDRGAPQRATVRISEVLPGRQGTQPAPGASTSAPGGNRTSSSMPGTPGLAAPATPSAADSSARANTPAVPAPAPTNSFAGASPTAPTPTLGPVVGRAERVMVAPAVAQVGQRLAVTLQNFPQPNNDRLLVVTAGTPDTEQEQGRGGVLFQQSIYSVPAQPIEIGPFAPGQYEVRYLTTLYNNERRYEVSARTAFSVR